MPNWEAVDPKDGRRWTWDGKQWTPAPSQAPVSATKRLLTQSAGVPEDTDTSVATNKAELQKQVANPGEALRQGLSQFLSSINPAQGMRDAEQTAVKRFAQPGIGNKLPGALEYLESGVPWAGPGAAHATEQMLSGDYAGGVGSSINAGLLATGLGKEAPRLAESHPIRSVIGATVGSEPVKSVIRHVSGAGSAPESLAADRNLEAINAANEDNRLTLERARDTHLEKQADRDFNQKARQAAYEESLNKVRLANAQAKQAFEQGVASEASARQLTKQVAETLPKLEEAETAKAKAAYPTINGTVEPGDIHGALEKAVSEKLKGVGPVPRSIARILEETSPEPGYSTGPSIMGRTLDLSKPTDLEAYRRFKSQGVFSPAEIARIEGDGGKPLTFDKLHGMYSELGREEFSGNLPGDAKAALAQARAEILGRMQTLADTEGKRGQFEAAQKNWRQLEHTFRNTSPASMGGSPIARALRARDPISGALRPDYVRQILADDKAYGVSQELLDRYPGASSVQNSLHLMKNYADAAKGAPKRVSLKPEPAPPTVRPVREMRPPVLRDVPPEFDPAKWREEQLRKHGANNQVRAYNFMPWRIPFTIAESLINRLLSDPAYRRIIAR